MGKWSGKACRLTTMMLMTALLFLVELVVGYVTNSIALVTDSFHMLSDLVALIVGLTSIKVSKWKSTRNTFGWQRAEVLGAMVNAVFLFALCFSILVESLKRIVLLEEVENPKMMLIVGGVGLLVNLIGLGLFGGHGHSHGGSHSHGHSHHGHSHGDQEPFVQSNSQNHHHHHNHHQQEHHHSYNNNHNKAKCQQQFVLNTNEKLDHSLQGSTQNGDVRQHECEDTGELKSLMSVYSEAKAKSDGINENGNRETFGECNCHIDTLQRDGRETKTVDITARDKEVMDVDIEMETPSTSTSLNMRGVFLHVLGDALGSVVVVISGTVIWLVDGHWKYYLDPVLSIVIVMIILKTTIPLFKETALIMLQAVPDHVSVDAIRKQILQLDGVEGIHECHIWQLSGSKCIGSTHVKCRDLKTYNSAVNSIKQIFHSCGIHSTTIQLEISNTNSSGAENGCVFTCPTVDGQDDCSKHLCCS